MLDQTIFIWACDYLALVLELKQSYRVYPDLAMGIAVLKKLSQDKRVFPMMLVDYLCFCTHIIWFAVEMQSREMVTCY